MDLGGTHGDRRRWTRVKASLPCKARLAGEVRYAPGVSHDLSRGGACIEVRSQRPVGAGERLEVLLARAGSALIEAKDARAARIVRVERLSDATWRIAVAYERAAALAA